MMTDECRAISLGQVHKHRVKQGLHLINGLGFVHIQKTITHRTFVKIIVIEKEMKNLIDV